MTSLTDAEVEAVAGGGNWDWLTDGWNALWGIQPKIDYDDPEVIRRLVCVCVKG